MKVWLDRTELLPGQRWREAIRKAIQDGYIFIACFSQNYESRGRSFMNEELTLAIEELRMRPTDRLWFLPVLLSASSVPDREIGAGETLRDIQWVDLHSDWDAGIQQIKTVLMAAQSKAELSGPEAWPKPIQYYLDTFLRKAVRNNEEINFEAIKSRLVQHGIADSESVDLIREKYWALQGEILGSRAKKRPPVRQFILEAAQFLIAMGRQVTVDAIEAVLEEAVKKFSIWGEISRMHNEYEVDWPPQPPGPWVGVPLNQELYFRTLMPLTKI